MTVLSIIQDHAKLHALQVPVAAVSSTDTTAIQLLAILKELVNDISSESDFSAITKEATWTATATESQGLLTALAADGYKWMIGGTFYDRTQGRPVQGPLSPQEWQAIKAVPTSAPQYSYRIREQELLIYPTPAAPLSEFAFEYASTFIVKDAGGTAKAQITADDDTFVIPEDIMRKGMMYRWKVIKGLPYQEDEQKYYDMLNTFISRNGTRKVIDVGEPGGHKEIIPTILVPTGNWNL